MVAILRKLLLLLFLTSLGACQSPQPLASPLDSPVAGPAPVEVAGLLPKNGVKLGEPFTFDFDGDGINEVEVAYTSSDASDGGGLVVGRSSGTKYSVLWQVSTPVNIKVTEFKTRDMLKDNSYELLLFCHTDGTDQFPLYVYKWRRSTFVLMKPSGGELDGQDSFTSDYYPTTLGDVDDDGIMEIVPTYEFDPNAEYLKPIVYQWNGKDFAFTDFYILPPRFKPEK